MKLIFKLFYSSILLVLILSCNSKHIFLNIGHRGAMGHVLENTLPSIQKALDFGVDMIEIDVFVCKTGELVVFHDETLDRLSDFDFQIEDLTLNEIKSITLKGGYNIPTLSEVIDLINQKVPLNIELKGNSTAIATFNLLDKYYKNGFKNEHFIISSFKWDELEIFRKLDSSIDIAVLTEDNPIDAISFAESINAVSINPWFKNLTKSDVDVLKSKGFNVYAYTVNENEDIKTMMDWGVDGVFTNFPERVNELKSKF